MEKILKGAFDYKISADGDHVGAFVETRGGIECITLTFACEEAEVPPKISVRWEEPHVDIIGAWHANSFTGKLICGACESNAACSAPLVTFYSASGMNRRSVACSDAVNSVRIGYTLREEDSFDVISFDLFGATVPPMTSYSCELRIDRRDVRYEDAIADVRDWWAAMPEYEPMTVADECTRPLYSTWYSFHQMAYGDEIEEVLRSCAALGFSSVIVDDGWQMADYSRTYNWCGDWEVAPEKIADMKAHVDRVHALGMKYLMWYSVPFVGKYSKAYERFRRMCLPVGLWGGTDVLLLDPRYPEVREYLISTYENAMRDWGVDGFKLDFVDCFSQPKTEREDAAPGKDFVSVFDALDCMMTQMKARLRAIEPNVCIEFRQSYVGPKMRSYANMFRAGDCANDTVSNKLRTIDIHLLLGDSPAHCDMLTWNPGDTVESAALQLVTTMFSVPQISVRPLNLPESHNRMLKDWLTFWKENRDTLLFGKFRAHDPEILYSQASAESEDSFIAVSFANGLVMKDAEGDVKKRVFVNGSGEAALVLNVRPGRYKIVIENCMGEATYIGERDLDGVELFDVPVAGRITLTE